MFIGISLIAVIVMFLGNLQDGEKAKSIRKCCKWWWWDWWVKWRSWDHWWCWWSRWKRSKHCYWANSRCWWVWHSWWKARRAEDLVSKLHRHTIIYWSCWFTTIIVSQAKKWLSSTTIMEEVLLNTVLGQRLDGCPVTQQQVGRRVVGPTVTRRDRTLVAVITRTPEGKILIHQVKRKTNLNWSFYATDQIGFRQ